jgi:peptidyl-dipeptidase Dcp
MKKSTCFLAACCILLASCNTDKKKVENPFFSEYKTPHQVPPFDKIKPVHYLPAFKEGIKEQKEAIEKIVKNSEKPTFANTIEALERSSNLLDKVSYVFDNVKGANTNDELDKIEKQILPLISSHSDDIKLNMALFSRIKSIYDQEKDLNLSTEQKMVLKKYYNSFVRGGANLPKDKKDKLRVINKDLSELYSSFRNNVIGDNNKFKLVIDNKADLKGLPESVIANGAATAKEAGLDGKWMYTLDKPSFIPFMTYSAKRELRKKLYLGYTNKGNNNDKFDNKKIISKIISLRTAKAQLLGFKCFADYVLDNNMAKNTKNVYKLCNRIWDIALPAAKKEVKELQKIINKEGDKITLKAWDWWYYAGKLKKAKYNLDEEMLRPYFKLENVRDGAFYLANKLYGIKFKQVYNLPLYHKDCQTFEVSEANGDFIGVLYMDFFPRKSKTVGAWMTSYRKQSNLDKYVHPIISVVTNFSKPTGDKPALLSFSEVETLFHEFGHSLHGLLSKCKYNRVSGTAVARDFVELPSQVMENWCSEPEMLNVYAKHYKTGKAMPKELIAKLNKASHFNVGFKTVEFIAAALIDLEYHTTTSTKPINVLEFEKNFSKKIGLIDEITYRYRSTYFKHIFGSEGYATGYYAYTWAEVLDADAFNAFKETGDIFNKEVANKFRKFVISRGGSDDAMKLYIQFRGKEPNPDALLKRKGLLK